MFIGRLVGLRRRVLLGVAIPALLVPLIVGLPLPAQAVPAGGAIDPDVTSVPVSELTARAAATSSIEDEVRAVVVWPPASSTIAAVSGSSVRVGASPVSIRTASAVDVARSSVDGDAAVVSVRVEVLGRSASSSARIAGMVLRLTRADGGAGTGVVSVSVDYSGFRTAFGGSWGARLTLMRAPACLLTSRDVEACGAIVPLEGVVNNVTTGVVSGVVPVSPVTLWSSGEMHGADRVWGQSVDGDGAEPELLLLMAGSGSLNVGTFNKTDLSSTASWSAGSQSGEFSYRYPLRVPPAPGGLAPEVSLRYSSASVDGRTAAENLQTSWLGEGWDYQPGYIERRTRPCSQDTDNSPYYSNGSGDACYRLENATIMWNGRASELVKDDATGRWRMTVDDGSRIEYLTSGTTTGYWGNEHWRITTQDGTQYWFGRNRLPGWSTGDRETGSVFGQPTFANRSGEPGFSTLGFSSSWALLAYRWNLDYVVDTHGNSMAFYYWKPWSRVGLNNSATNTAAYNPGGWLHSIEYGTVTGHEYDNTTPPMQVIFDATPRCLASCYDSSGEPVPGSWPDMPWDLYCPTTVATCDQKSPSFWLTTWLSTVTTQVYSGGSYKDVDRWSLAHRWPATHDNTDPSAWLDSIAHTGKGARLGVPDVAMPSMVFGSGPAPGYLANRTDYNTSLGVPPVNKYRIGQILTETGGEVDVAYDPSDCTAASQPDPDQNPKRCFPQWYVPPGDPALAGFSWWNKYRVASVTEKDLVGGSPDVVHTYGYSTAGSSTTVLWHHDDEAWGRQEDYRSWSDFRGWSTVTVTTGSVSGQKSQEQFLYYRGLQGDKTDAGYGTRAATSTDSEGSTWQDWPQRRGFLQEHTVRDGPSGIALRTTISQPVVVFTGTRTESTSWALPSTFQSAYLRGAVTFDKTKIAATSTWRVHQINTNYDTTYALPTDVTDWGDNSVSGDETCTRLLYNRNTSLYLVNTVVVKEVATKDCGQTPSIPIDLLSRTRWYYDGATSTSTNPTFGDVTRVDEASTYTGSLQYVTSATMTYDSLGRELTSTDALNHTTTTAYTPTTGGPVTAVAVTNPASHTITTTFDAGWGLPVTVTDPNGKVTTGSYDALGQLRKVWLPGRSTSLTPNTEYSYSVTKTAPSYVATKVLGPTGTQVTSYEIYDGLLRLRQKQSPVSVSLGGRWIADTAYDGRGLVVKSSVLYNNTAGPSSTLVSFLDSDMKNQHRISYDGANRPLTDQLWSLNAERWRTTTSYGGDRVTTDPPTGGTATTAFTNVFGKTVTLRQYLGADPSGTYQDTSYSYDKAQRLTGMTDVAGNQWSYTFDLRGRQIQSIDPDKGTSTSTYDDAGQVLTTTDARGVVLAYSYDNLGRKTSLWQNAVTTGTKLAEWTYDTIAAGRLTSSTRYDSGNAYTTAVTGYDDAYRPLGTRTTFPAVEGALSTSGPWTTSSTYNVDGSVATVSYPSSGGLSAETVTNTYDANGFLLTVAGGATYVSDTSYFPWGATYQRILGSGTARVRLTTGFDEATGRLDFNLVDTENPSTPGNWVNRLSDDYNYDPAGNVTSIVSWLNLPQLQASTQCFTYDGLRRLTEAWTIGTSFSQQLRYGHARLRLRAELLAQLQLLERRQPYPTDPARHRWRYHHDLHVPCRWLSPASCGVVNHHHRHQRQ